MGNVIGYYKVFTTGDADAVRDPEVWPTAARHVSVTQWLYPYTEDTKEAVRDRAVAKSHEVSLRLGGVLVRDIAKIKGMSAYAIRVGHERIEA